ncbi:MAG: hypothetical protein ACQGVC_22135 [Myxococcota bacterium]
MFVLTDGSGRSGDSRLATTTALLRRAGIDTGGLYGRHTDAEVYEALLDGRSELFVSLARELAKEIAAERIEIVVGDAAEGYNPIHDAFRLTLNAAVELARSEAGTGIESYDFPLFLPPASAGSSRSVRLDLSPPEREAKRREAGSYVELEREVEWSLKQHGKHAFDREWLRPVTEAAGEYPFLEDTPIYERYGEFLAEAGEQDRVIRGGEHLAPIARALRDAARG